MGTALDHLLDVLDLERIDRDIFRGRNETSDWFRLFGGQVAAQALAAAQRTVADHRAHSLHGYFLRGGDPKTPVTYTVDRIRDGRSFSTRRVVALQDGRAIFNTSISFHTEEQGYEHQDDMPDVPGPEGLPTWADRAESLKDKIPEERRQWMLRERAIETRSALPHSIFSGEPSTEPNPVWLRANGDVPDDPDIHAQLITYASDIAFVDNMYRPHRRPGGPGVMLASLDHAIWFHRPIRLDDWVLFHQDSPSAAGARGFARGGIYDRSGVHLASVAQEGVMRELDPTRTNPENAHN
ncbi:MAG: acyl-CoA thioesterase II [Actinomycetota bacterium]